MDNTQTDAINDAIRTIGIRHRALAAAILAPLGLHPGQEVIIKTLAAQGPRTQGQLACSSGCEPPTISGTVRKLEAAGIITRHTSDTDGRVVIVELTPRGHDLLPELEAASQRLAQLTVHGLSPDKVDALCALLAEVATCLTTTTAACPQPSTDPDLIGDS